MEKTKEEIILLWDSYAKQYPNKKFGIYLFGSYEMGILTNNSDIDILVVPLKPIA